MKCTDAALLSSPVHVTGPVSVSRPGSIPLHSVNLIRDVTVRPHRLASGVWGARESGHARALCPDQEGLVRPALAHCVTASRQDPRPGYLGSSGGHVTAASRSVGHAGATHTRDAGALYGVSPYRRTVRYGREDCTVRRTRTGDRAAAGRTSAPRPRVRPTPRPHPHTHNPPPPFSVLYLRGAGATAPHAPQA